MSERRGTKGLELWCKKMTEGYPGVKIENMTTSWRDGLAFCAIIHHFRPDLIDFSKLNKNDIYHNNELAFRTAEYNLGIPALLEPEDMVEYTVPDRLSILTYLAQFYQAFAEQRDSSRIANKRPQPSTDRDIGSPTSSSPPTKVASIVTGKIRREPCAKCSLPVFLAERLNIGKLLFHRTCFKCARCNSQLTLASYYETENGEYCCEMCPDEETFVSKTSNEKLLLQRSMSDEEKSASLRMITSQPDDYSSMFESALEDVNDTKSDEFAQARSRFFSTQMASSDSGNEDEPPKLPKSEPPGLNKSDIDNSITSNQSDSGFPNVLPVHSSKVSIEKPLDSSRDLEKPENIVTKEEFVEKSNDVSLVKARMRLFENDTSKSDVNRNSQISSTKVPTLPVKPFIPIVKLDELENFDISKKDINDTDDKKISTVRNEDDVSLYKNNISENVMNSPAKLSNTEKTETSKVSEEQTPYWRTQKYTRESPKKESEDITIAAVAINENVDIKPRIKEIDILKTTEDRPKSSQIERIKPPIAKKYEYPKSKDIVSPKISPEKEINEQDSIISSKDSLGLSSENQDSSVLESEILGSSEDSKVSDNKQNMSEELDSKDIIVIEDSLEEETESPIKEELNSESNVIVIESSPESKENMSESLENNELKSDDSLAEDSPIQNLSPVIETDVNNIDNSMSPSEELTDVEKQPQHDKSLEEDYPEDLNPFGDNEEKSSLNQSKSLNPFGSEDEDEETQPPPPPKPAPTPRMKKKILPKDSDRVGYHGTPIRIARISVNPFESDEEDTEAGPPVPATRKKKTIEAPRISLNPFSSEDEENEEYVKQPVPTPRVLRTSVNTPEPRPRDYSSLAVSSQGFYGSNTSISSGSVQGSARKKKLAPRPPIPNFNDSTPSSLTTSPSQSVTHSPRSTPKHRKSRRAPLPPGPLGFTSVPFTSTPFASPIENEVDPSDKGKENEIVDGNQMDSLNSYLGETDIEKEKSVKDEQNRSRQNYDHLLQSPTSSENSLIISAGPNKSSFGQWKRKKAQAPKRPIPQRRVIKCLPMSEIRRELDLIEVQQQGLEKQGVRLEQIIREKCEGTPETNQTEEELPIEVEDLILQLFEIVNEKNELFRKQAELMYLKRQQRLEEEHADVEYQIRCLMLKPEDNKTDSDKAREEELIKRLVDIVERRNEIIECLEMDRVREAEEDSCISNHINLYTSKRDSDKLEPDTEPKEKEKEKKKKHKKEFKLRYKSKSKIDADKDIDESETQGTLEKKKKKKFNLF